MTAKREYKKSTISELLKVEGTSNKKFAKWLNVSEEGLSRRLKAAEEKGLDKELESSLKMFLMEKRGISIKVDGI
jgi:predicted transcriptional regulator